MGRVRHPEEFHMRTEVDSTKAKAKATKAEEPKSALAKPSRLDPDPEGRARAKAETERVERERQAPAIPETKHLDLGAGYKLNHKPGSGHSVVVKVLAREGRFAEVAQELAADKYDASDKDQAADLLTKLMVPKDSIEEIVRSDQQFKRHAAKRVAALKVRADAGDKKAAATLENETRISNGQWVGNVKEILSTCNGSYLVTMQYPAPGTLPEEHRNVRKFHDAGVIFRQYPIEPAAADKVYLMMYPSAFRDKVIEAIKTVHAVDEHEIVRKMLQKRKK